MDTTAATDQSLILVADDDGPFRTLAALVLRGAGFKVVEARDGTEALAKIDEHDFEMVLLDVRMPGASGWEVLESIIDRAEEENPPPRALIMTGLTTEFDLDRLKRAGAQGMLIKPFQNEDLVVEVRRIMKLPREMPPTGTADPA